MRALWVVGWDILQTQPNTTATEHALANLDMLVVQDLFMNETAREHGTIFLPACSTFEKDGTFMNGERRVQRVRQVIEPLGDTKPDWEIVGAVAGAMGHGHQFAFTHPRQIWDEIRKVWPAGAGISYDRLDASGGVQWPCPTEDHPGTTLLHTTAFAALGPVASLHRVAYEPSPERPDPEFPLLLITGRALDQFNAGTMTRRSLTNELRSTDMLDIAADDATRSRYQRRRTGRRHQPLRHDGTPPRISRQVVAGQLFATFSDPETHLNRLTGPHRDRVTNTPEYKRTMVRVRRRHDEAGPRGRLWSAAAHDARRLGHERHANRGHHRGELRNRARDRARARAPRFPISGHRPVGGEVSRGLRRLHARPG